MNIWYYIVRFYVKIGLFFTIKNIEVFGKENIPKKGATIFIGNHQNALIDAVLIPTTNTRDILFLTRASVFKNPLISKILRSLNLIPVYRIRDGKSSLQKNIEVFKHCFEALNNQRAIQIFAEGEHHLKRRILPLKKGFARIILGTLQKYPDLDIQIVPVGLNYDTHLNYPFNASIYYGKPIRANDYINPTSPDYSFKELLDVVRNALKEVTLHIDDLKTYDTNIEKLTAANINFLNPVEANNALKNIETLKPTKISKKINWFFPIHFITKLNSVFPLLLWKYIKPTISDVIFRNTFRLAILATIFPLFHLLQTLVVYLVFNSFYALIYLLITVLFGIISAKTMQVNP